MRLTLDESLTVLHGQQEVRFTNEEDVELKELYLHLFPNLLGGSTRVTAVSLDGKSSAPSFEAAGALMRLPLTESLSPGAQVTLYIEFKTEIPSDTMNNYGIFVFSEEILALAHFYPVLAVFDEEGWNIEPPVAGGDIAFSDTSFYLVEVTAPANLLMASSGIELSREIAGEKNVVTYAAGPVRDFYLVGSAKYQLLSARSGETVINSFAPEEYGSAAVAILETVTAALTSFGTRFGPYPYTELDVVSAPLLALGVEYPGIFANAISLYRLDNSEDDNLNRVLLEAATAHATAHQWFYGLVGNDQLNEPWLDESLTQYVTWLYFVDRYGTRSAQGFYQSLEERWARVDMSEIPIGLPVSAYEDGEYGAIVYGRGPIFIHELALLMGREEFDGFLRQYYEANKWGIATAAGFKQLAETYCSCDLTTMFRAWVYPQ